LANPRSNRKLASPSAIAPSNCSATDPNLIFLSAAQPQPNDLGEVKAFVPSWALCRAALKGATSSPNGEMRAGSVAEKFEGKSLEALADLQFPRRLPSIILDSKGRTLVAN